MKNAFAFFSILIQIILFNCLNEVYSERKSKSKTIKNEKSKIFIF